MSSTVASIESAQVDEFAPLSVASYDGMAALERFGREIDRLNVLSARPNPFLSTAFSKCYSLRSEYHVPGTEERLFTVSEGGRIIGCLLMRRSVETFGPAIGPVQLRGARLRFLTPLDTEQLGMVCAKQDEDRVAAALLRYICNHEQDWSMLELSGQRPGNALHRAMHALNDRRFRVRDFPVDPFNEIPITWPDPFSYFRSLAKKTRSNISRQARRLFAAGEVELILADGPAASSAWFDAYCDLDRRSWKNATDSSIRRNPRRVRFYQEIVAGRGGLTPSFVGVVLDGMLVAGIISGSFAVADSNKPRGTWCLEMAYDQSRADLGPGQLLLLLSMSEAIARGDGFLNFLHGFSYYKHRWAAVPIDVVNVQLIRRASVHNLKTLLGELRSRVRHTHAENTTAPAHETDSEQGKAPATSDINPAKEVTARALTERALAYTGEGLRRLNRQLARDYLPFDID
jgi:Acetyltransferase (GNAT) domain